MSVPAGDKATVHQRGGWFLSFKKVKKEDELFLRHRQEACTFQMASRQKMRGIFVRLWFLLLLSTKMSMTNTLKDCIFHGISEFICVLGRRVLYGIFCCFVFCFCYPH